MNNNNNVLNESQLNTSVFPNVVAFLKASNLDYQSHSELGVRVKKVTAYTKDFPDFLSRLLISTSIGNFPAVEIHPRSKIPKYTYWNKKQEKYTRSPEQERKQLNYE